MNYEETLDYLFKRLPMYQRVGAAAYKEDLSNTHLLCGSLSNPERKFKSIHVAGTNGKGSTSHMLASILQEAGYKVGLYTSPHLKDFRERIKINGEMIAKEDVVAFVDEHKINFERIELSFFEWTVGLAFDYFSNQKVDIAIIETGLGGRLDSTNVINPEVSIITNIGIDHTQFLGETLALIAVEKAGIIKAETPIVIGETKESIKTIFRNIAIEKKAPICFVDLESNRKFKTDLLGKYQYKNQITCLETIKILNNIGWQLTEKNIENGLLNVVENTGLMGRWQILGDSPLIICDIGHNREAIEGVVKQLELTKYNALHVVFGAVNDKSIDEILNLLPKKANYYYCQAKIPRAMDVDNLLKLGLKIGLKGKAYESVNSALNVAKGCASKDDLVFIGGSTFVVAEVL